MRPTWAAPCGWVPIRRRWSRDRSWPRRMQSTDVSERHRHRYEVNNAYRDRIAESGLRFSGTSPDGHLVEFVEYPREVHPFLVGTQAHPELKSRPTRPHPLFARSSARRSSYKAAERLPVEIPEQHPNGREHPDNAAERGPSRSQSTSTCPWLSTISTPSPPKPSTAERFSRCAPTRCGCPAATPPSARSSSTTARWPSPPSTTTPTGRDGLPVPPSARPAAVGAARRAARRGRGGPRG